MPLFTDILTMVCGCVDNLSPDRFVPLYIGTVFLTRTRSTLDVCEILYLVILNT